MLRGLQNKLVKLHDADVVDEDYDANDVHCCWVRFRDYTILKDSPILVLDTGYCNLEGGSIEEETFDEFGIDAKGNRTDGFHVIKLVRSAMNFTLKQKLRLKHNKIENPVPNFEALFTRQIKTTITKEAEIRAENLLRDHLSETEFQRYKRKHRIIVTSATGKTYSVPKWGKIKVLDSSYQPLAELCVHSEGVPLGDHLLHMKTLIENEEEIVWKKSNVKSLVKA